jgi:acyl-CoA thioester hydrolase
MTAPQGAYHFHFPVRVRYSEIDSQNIVFNSRYLEYCDAAVTEYFRTLGFPPIDLVKVHGCNLVVAHAEIDFLAPGRFDDLLNVFVRVAEMGRTSLTTSIEIYPEPTETLAFRGRFVQVNIDEAAGRPVPVPANVREAVVAFENWP